MPESLASINADTFNRKAKAYDDKPYMVALADQVAAALQQALPLGAQTAVLEFGCGTGLLSARLAPIVGSMHGSDIADAMVEVYNQKAAAKGYTNMKAVCVDVLDAAARDQAISSGDLPRRYDLILINMTAHHLEDIPAVLRSLSSLLLPRGKLVLTDLLATERSKQFHGRHAHHSVSHHGEQPAAATRWQSLMHVSFPNSMWLPPLGLASVLLCDAFSCVTSFRCY